MNNAVAAQQCEIREVWRDDAAGLQAVAELHMELLDYGPMAGLGERFVREICYRAHMQDGVLRVWLARVQGVPAGFVAVTPFSLSFHRSGLRQHALRAAWETARAVLSQPTRLIRLLRALRVLGSRRHELQRAVEPLGEVVCIAVRPQFLTPRFQRATGLRLSETLVRRSAEYLRRAGVEDMRMLADVDNRPVLMLYHLMGAHFSSYALADEPMVEVWFDLRDGRLAADPSLPASWSAGAPARRGGSDWSAYWEEIGDHQEVFRAEARDHVERLRRILAIDANMRVLDFGCGFGFTAEHLAPLVAALGLWDGSANVRRRARTRAAQFSNVEFVDLSQPESSLPQGTFDLIIVHSVLQYMAEADIVRWLALLRRMLEPGGRLVLSDLIQPRTSALLELASYLRFSLRAGFFWDALVGGLRESAHYFSARNARPLTLASERQLREWAVQAGYTLNMLPENLSHRSHRRAAVLQPAATAQAQGH